MGDGWGGGEREHIVELSVICQHVINLVHVSEAGSGVWVYKAKP